MFDLAGKGRKERRIEFVASMVPLFSHEEVLVFRSLWQGKGGGRDT